MAGHRDSKDTLQESLDGSNAMAQRQSTVVGDKAAKAAQVADARQRQSPSSVFAAPRTIDNHRSPFRSNDSQLLMNSLQGSSGAVGEQREDLHGGEAILRQNNRSESPQ